MSPTWRGTLTPEQVRAGKRIKCKRCGRPVGEWCVNPDGVLPRPPLHMSRVTERLAVETATDRIDAASTGGL